MVDWSGLAAQKYAIDKQRADAVSQQTAADAALAATRASLMPAESAAAIGAQRAQANRETVTAGLLPGQAESENLLRRSTAGYYGAPRRLECAP